MMVQLWVSVVASAVQITSNLDLRRRILVVWERECDVKDGFDTYNMERRERFVSIPVLSEKECAITCLPWSASVKSLVATSSI